MRFQGNKQFKNRTFEHNERLRTVCCENQLRNCFNLRPQFKVLLVRRSGKVEKQKCANFSPLTKSIGTNYFNRFDLRDHQLTNTRYLGFSLLGHIQ